MIQGDKIVRFYCFAVSEFVSLTVSLLPLLVPSALTALAPSGPLPVRITATRGYFPQRIDSFRRLIPLPQRRLLITIMEFEKRAASQRLSGIMFWALERRDAD